MLPSQTVENYLKTIYLAQSSASGEAPLVPMGQLAAALSVVPGTATTMMKALSESGLVHYEPYMGVRLTPAGEKLATFNIGAGPITGPRIAVKEAVFPFSRLPGVDPLLGPEMRSTGEVMGLDVSFGAAYLKSQIAAGMALPAKGCVFISVREGDKASIEQPAREIAELGFTIIATAGTAQFLAERGIKVDRVNKVLEGQPHVVDALLNGKVQLVFNTTEGAQSLVDSASIRRAALQHGIPYYTTISGARAAVQAMRPNHRTERLAASTTSKAPSVASRARMVIQAMT